uniref:Ig-like domain-containing protein n=1 Tax=Lates calcarifer TaxID=8187 RepID=A0A4W6DHY5_LATCA
MVQVTLSMCLYSRTKTDNGGGNEHVRFISANVGDNVTLKCFYKGDVAAMFYWYKQTLGQKPRLVSSYYKHDKHGTFTEEFKNNTRFSLDTKDDSATYYCISCYAYKFEFGEGATLSVKGSGLNIQLCDSQLYSTHWTCDGEHSVYWFKSSEESHPGLIYTHGDRNDQCERKPNTQTHTCIYNLPMESLSHAGTYYCAVASCGHILFGNGTKLDLAGKYHKSQVNIFYLNYLLDNHRGMLSYTMYLFHVPNSDFYFYFS